MAVATERVVVPMTQAEKKALDASHRATPVALDCAEQKLGETRAWFARKRKGAKPQ
jgi:hypothetical protein